MANEKSRNHEPTGRNAGGNGKAQGRQDSDKVGNSGKSGSTGSARSASGKPGPGKQARDQLNVRTDANSAGKQD